MPKKPLYLLRFILGALLVLMFFLLVYGLASFWGGWVALDLIAAIVSLFAGLLALKCSRVFDGMPNSSISSAAQGYVRLCGTGLPLQESKLWSPMTGARCLWYRYLLEERNSKGQWISIDEKESSKFFLIDDGTGRCIVNPNGAAAVTQHKRSYAKGANQRVTEWLLRINDKIYTVGEFSSQHGVTIAASADENVPQVSKREERNTDIGLGEILRKWKLYPDKLRRRFDLNEDGVIDTNEWELARQAARRELTKRQHEIDKTPSIHCLSCPSNGQEYLITNIRPDRLSSNASGWARICFAIFIGTLIMLGWCPRL